MDDLRRLRDEIGAVDRALLEQLNRRLELVRRINTHKREAGAPVIDAEREAELLRELNAANAGPLSEPAVQSVFASILDVMKQELRRDGSAGAAAPGPRRAAPAVARVAVVGTGLLGTSVGLAARRAGSRVAGWDVDEGTLREAAGAQALDAAAASLADAVADAELVVVAVPVGSLAATAREALAASGPATTVTDVGSTKRGIAGVDDARLVPGHPLAGGASGGPARATADLFDGATWFVTPTPASDGDRVELVERFAASLGARPIRLDADTHDRVLALTSHLPHALANLLMESVAAGGDEALGYAGASLREMTRVAGANAAVWADIFVENADLLADAVAVHRDRAGDVERALRERDRTFFERWIDAAASARTTMLEYAYRTDARTLNRIRVRVPDKPGVLARITQTLGAAGINIEDFELRHVSPEYGGVLVVLVAGNENAELARTLLRREGYSAA
ncbi:MAG TPA: prephenate dehydrogenase/arogenate dehydrogenase family protein [Gaiellaceae bacterium]|nr:prephenate dehydrogenase/arogenate dehydrogenase family protein [Gaiellaceae bacterium]